MKQKLNGGKMIPNLLSRANLSNLEAITNPTRSPEEMKNDDFEGDVLNVFQYNYNIEELENLEIKKSKLQEMSKNSLFKLSYQGEHQRIDIQDQPWGTTKCSPLFENEFVESIYKRGNLKQIPLALA